MGVPRGRLLFENNRKRGRHADEGIRAGNGCECPAKLDMLVPQLVPALHTAKETKRRADALKKSAASVGA